MLSTVLLNSILGMSGSGVFSMLLSRLIVKQWSAYRLVDGMLAGGKIAHIAHLLLSLH